MLMPRIITAAILIPIVLLAIIFLPIQTFGIVTALLFTLCAVEWAGFIHLSRVRKIAYIIFTLALLIVLSYIPLIMAKVFLWIGLLWWLLALVLLVTYPKFNQVWQNQSTQQVVGWCLIIPCWSGINVIIAYPYGRLMLILLLILIWAADSAAYFVGKKHGKRKIAAAISPNKTIEGLQAGILASAIVAIISVLVLPKGWLLSVVYFILYFVMVFVALHGDLTESMLKRLQGVKDSGNILPGHGGLLDRLDSLLACAPIFALGLLLIY